MHCPEERLHKKEVRNSDKAASAKRKRIGKRVAALEGHGCLTVSYQRSRAGVYVVEYGESLGPLFALQPELPSLISGFMDQLQNVVDRALEQQAASLPGSVAATAHQNPVPLQDQNSVQQDGGALQAPLHARAPGSLAAQPVQSAVLTTQPQQNFGSIRQTLGSASNNPISSQHRERLPPRTARRGPPLAHSNVSCPSDEEVEATLWHGQEMPLVRMRVWLATKAGMPLEQLQAMEWRDLCRNMWQKYTTGGMSHFPALSGS